MKTLNWSLTQPLSSSFHVYIIYIVILLHITYTFMLYIIHIYLLYIIVLYILYVYCIVYRERRREICFTSDTAHFVFIHITSVVEAVHIFMVRNKFSKSCLLTEFCFYRFAHFSCVLMFIFGFHCKQCASNKKQFTKVMYRSTLKCLVALMGP